MAQPTFAPTYNPSMALLPGGWPFCSVNGSGMLGNASTHEITGTEVQGSTDAAKLQSAKAQNPNGTSARVV